MIRERNIDGYGPGTDGESWCQEPSDSPGLFTLDNSSNRQYLGPVSDVTSMMRLWLWRVGTKIDLCVNYPENYREITTPSVYDISRSYTGT